MARDLAAGMLSAIQAGIVRPVIFYQGQYAADTLRLWSGIGSVSWNSQTWLGAGQLLSVSQIQETSDTRAVGWSVTLTGQSSGLIARALASCRQGMPGYIWLGALAADGTIIANPYQVRAGRLDFPTITDDGPSCTISIAYEDRLIALQRAHERRYTSEDQQIDYPDDLGFDFVPSLQNKSITWAP